jgi:hypothetical protein
MAIQDEGKVFEQRLADYKQMVILRQEECAKTGAILGEKGRELSIKGRRYKNWLIILGVVVAAKAALELAMIGMNAPRPTMNVLSIIFLVIGIIVSMIAALDKANRYEEKSGECKSLSTLCKSYDRRFMSDYKKYLDPQNPAITLAKLESLIELQNESLDNIRQRSDNLGIDLSSLDVSYRLDTGR